MMTSPKNPGRTAGRKPARSTRRVVGIGYAVVGLATLAIIWWSLDAYLQDREAAAFLATLALLPLTGPLVRLSSVTYRAPR